jgi:hypothetical protein
MVKFDKDSKIVWEKAFNGIGSDFINFNDLAILDNGNIVVAGHLTIQVDTDAKGRSDAFIYIFSQDDGTLINSKIFSGKGEDIFFAVAPAESNGFVVCGKSDSSSGDFSANSNGSAIIISFDYEQLKFIDEMNSGIELWYLCDEITPEIIAKASALNSECWLSPDFASNTAETIQLAIDAGIGCSFWTVNELEDAKMLYDMGIRYIETDIFIN